MRDDVRLALRSLRSAPVFVAVVVLVLAVGIGASVAFFSVIDAVLLRPLPFPQAERIVWMSERHEEIPRRQLSYANFYDWQSRARSFEAMGVQRDTQQYTLTGSGEPSVLDAHVVSSDYFRVMGIAPELGRVFNRDEDRFGTPLVALISHALWQDRFGSQRDVLGRKLTLEGKSVEIIGVMPESFRHGSRTDLWTLAGQYVPPEAIAQTRSNRTAGYVVARLKTGITIEQARQEMGGIERQLAVEYPVHNAGNTIDVETLRDSMVGSFRPLLWLAFGAAGLLLLIACVNVSNFMLVKGVARQKEIATRAAVGASPGRVVRELLVESVLLAGAGGLLGVLFAHWVLDLLLPLAPQDLWQQVEIGMDVRSVFFALLVSVVTGVVFGLVPAWHAARGDLAAALTDGGRATGSEHTGRLRSLFLVAQTAFAVLLLIGAGLLVNSLGRMFSANPGFDATNVLTFRVLPRDGERPASPPQLKQFYPELLQRLAGLSGVESVALANEMPGTEPTWQTDINPEINGSYQKIKPGELINVDWSIVSADFFKTLRIPLTKGRTFTPQEIAQGAPVMIVDEHLAQRFWPAGDAVGKHIKYDSPTPIEIIGTAANLRPYDSTAEGRIRIFTPYGRSPAPRVTVAVRTSGVDPRQLVEPIGRTVRALSANAPLFKVETLEQQLAKHIAPRTFSTLLLSLFAGIATVLAAAGIYAVISFSVSERSRELGVRIALGATPAKILWLVVSGGMLLALVGIAAGVALAFVQTRLLSSLLFDLSAVDAATFALVSVLFALVALVACAIPAWRAVRIEPHQALRVD